MTQPLPHAFATAGGQVPTDVPASGPELSMAPTLLVAIVHGPTLVDPIVTLHTSRQRAVAALQEWARDHLQDLLGYVPMRLQGAAASLVDVQNELAGFTSLRADVQDVAVTL